MRLKRTFMWSKDRKPISIADAVEIELDGSGYGLGDLETLRESASNAHKLLGRLVETLHARGALDAAAVLDLLNGGWEQET